MNLSGITTDRKEVGTERPQVWMNLVINNYVPTPKPDLTKDTKNTTLPAYTPPANTPLPTTGKVGVRSRNSSDPSSNNGAVAGGVYAESVVKLGSLVNQEEDNPQVEHLRRVATETIKRAGTITKTDFYNIMDAAGHRNQDVILSILKQTPQIQINEGNFKYIHEDEA
jgi:hypothetical protein